MARFDTMLLMLDRRGDQCHEPPAESWRDLIEVWEMSEPTALGRCGEAIGLDEPGLELAFAE